MDKTKEERCQVCNVIKDKEPHDPSCPVGQLEEAELESAYPGLISDEY